MMLKVVATLWLVLGLALGLATGLSKSEARLAVSEIPSPFTCSSCHEEEVSKATDSGYLHPIFTEQQVENECVDCHIETYGSGLLVLYEPGLTYTHQIELPRSNNRPGYHLRLRSHNSRAWAISPYPGSYLFEPELSIASQSMQAPEIDGLASQSLARLRIRGVSLLQPTPRRVRVAWQTNLKADSEVACWPASDSFNHLPPKTASDSGMSNCLKCHPPTEFVISHPVGMRLSSRINPPLPLAPGRVVTCGTCHDPHGSSQPYILRLDQDDICLTCHPDYA